MGHYWFVVVALLAACGDDGGGSMNPMDDARAPACGDGVVEGDEACDDGNSDDFDACRTTCIGAACGDGVVQAGVETCDDGSANSDVVADACRTDCTAAGCGDGVKDAAEGCDDGNTDNTDACNSTCSSTSCGDNIVQPSVEECDAGGANSDTTADACRTNCTLARCGDVVTDTGEECDDANVSNTDACLTTCDAATCGDGYVYATVEECDNAGANSNTAPDACRTTCETAACLDMVVDTGEACDDGNVFNTDACLATCVAATCGDGFIFAGTETCDDANTDPGDACAACAAASCGDGYLWQGVEQCDAGTANNSNSSPNACRTDCDVASCGDGTVDSGEACDSVGVATAACDVDCTSPTCPDGVTNVADGETCDDGNGNNGDGCTSCAIDAGWIVFVNVAAGGTNNGTSWTNAYVSLADALAATSQGEIWVAAGTYFADRGVGRTLGDRNVSFDLKSNVAVYGGFAGNEIARVQRNVVTNVSRLSGDIGLVDVATDNTQRIVVATSVTNARIDGFTIERGYGTAAGAGLAVSGTLVVGNCTAQANTVQITQASGPANNGAFGGAMRVSGTVTIERSTFSNNRALNSFNSNGFEEKEESWGGAIYVSSGSELTVLDSVFSSNSAGSSQAGAYGGAISSNMAVLRIARTTFSMNTAGDGGAISWYNFNVGTPSSSVQQCVFDGNSAVRGGATAGYYYPSAAISNSLFTDNSATSTGGAAWTSGVGAGIRYVNCTFVDNTAGNSSGAGAVHLGDFVGNSVQNSVFWGNRRGSFGVSNDITEGTQSNSSVSYSSTQTAASGWGATNSTLSKSPFATNYRLAAGNVSIDSGSNTNVRPDILDLDRDGDLGERIPFDLNGTARFLDDPTKTDGGLGTAPLVDRGAYERR